MPSETSRSLAAIMFTDIQGYTSLMQKDEGRAIILRKRHREVFERFHTQFEGKILQYYGDGTLSVFDSSVQAVQCAIAIQQKLSLEPHVPLRIGIHIGDILKTKDEVIGDGVNVASRIENLGVPGSVLFSKSVQQQVKNQGVNTVSLGLFQLKNVVDPIEVFAVNEKFLVVPTQEQMAEKGHPVDESQTALKSGKSIFLKSLIGLLFIFLAYYIGIKPLLQETNSKIQTKVSDVLSNTDKSIAVLPFINLSNDVDQEYFSDGMMDEILNHLYKIGGLRIPSRTSSMRYKGVNDKSIQEMGSELGVAHVLEGSVTQFDDSVRIIVSLINVQADSHLWSQDYKEEIKDVFAIQSNIAQHVAAELKAYISPEVKDRIETVPTENSEAYNLFLQAQYFLTQTMELEKARPLLDQAIQLDNNFAEPYALLGYYWLFRGAWLGDLESKDLLEKALPLLNKAKEINKDYPATYVYLSLVNLWYQWDFKEAQRNWDTFFKLSPSNHSMVSNYCDFLNASGKFAKAADLIDNAIQHDPSYSHWGSGLSFYFNGQHEKAIRHYETALRLFPNDGLINGLARLYIYSEKYAEAIQVLEPYIEKGNPYPRPLGNLAIAYYHTQEQSKADSILNVLKLQSEESSVGSPAFYISMIYAQKEDRDSTFYWLEKAYKDREVEMYWLNVEPPFEPVKGDARWKKMIDRLGFPQ